jgi:hypothetical protein
VDRAFDRNYGAFVQRPVRLTRKDSVDAVRVDDRWTRLIEALAQGSDTSSGRDKGAQAMSKVLNALLGYE